MLAPLPLSAVARTVPLRVSMSPSILMTVISPAEIPEESRFPVSMSPSVAKVMLPPLPSGLVAIASPVVIRRGEEGGELSNPKSRSGDGMATIGSGSGEGVAMTNPGVGSGVFSGSSNGTATINPGLGSGVFSDSGSGSGDGLPNPISSLIPPISGLGVGSGILEGSAA